MQNRALVFTLEAFVALLLALSFLLVLQPSPFSTRNADVYSYQLAQDVAGVTMRNYEKDLISFSHGDAAASLQLQSVYEKMSGAVGTYCLELESNGHSLQAHCDSPPSESFVAQRIFWDGEKFAVAEFRLGR